jgi:hypothetical protein
MGRPAGSTGFCRVVAPAGLLTNPDRSSHRVDLPGRSEFNNYDCNIFGNRNLWLGDFTREREKSNTIDGESVVEKKHVLSGQVGTT